MRNIYLNSKITLENIDALAFEEAGSGSYDVFEDLTEHKMNGVCYKESKVVNCTLGGSWPCSEGKYYRLKNSDNKWGEWIPA